MTAEALHPQPAAEEAVMTTAEAVDSVLIEAKPLAALEPTLGARARQPKHHGVIRATFAILVAVPALILAACGGSAKTPAASPTLSTNASVPTIDASPSATPPVVIATQSPGAIPTATPTPEVTPNPDAITPDELIAQIQSGDALKLYPNTTKAKLIKLGDSLIDSSNGSLRSLLFFQSKDTLHTRIGLCTDEKTPQIKDSNCADLTAFAFIAQGKLPNSEQANAFLEAVSGYSAHALKGKDDQYNYILALRDSLSSIGGN